MPFERVVLPVFISSVIPRTLVAHQFIAHTCLPKVSPPSTLLSELRPSPMSNRRKQPWMPHGVPMNARAAFKPASTPQRQPKFYAIQRGRNGYNGIVNTWEECKPFVSGVSGAIFKSFRTQAEARAFVQRGVNAARPVTHTAPRPPLPIAQTRPLPQAGASAGTTQQAPSTDPSESLNELYRYTKADELAAAAADPSDEAPEKLVVFTDGACTGNGTHKAKAGYGIYFGRESPYNVAEALPGQASNQRAEMTAVLEAMRITLDHGLVAKKGRLLVYTDSKVCCKHLSTLHDNLT